MSRRDCMIVAWHEVPGTARAPNEPSRRARYDRCGCADGFDDRPRCSRISTRVKLMLLISYLRYHSSMANTFSCLHIHCVFSTKQRVPILNPDIRERLWTYLGGIAN